MSYTIKEMRYAKGQLESKIATLLYEFGTVYEVEVDYINISTTQSVSQPVALVVNTNIGVSLWPHKNLSKRV